MSGGGRAAVAGVIAGGVILAVVLSIDKHAPREAPVPIIAPAQSIVVGPTDPASIVTITGPTESAWTATPYGAPCRMNGRTWYPRGGVCRMQDIPADDVLSITFRCPDGYTQVLTGRPMQMPVRKCAREMVDPLP